MKDDLEREKMKADIERVKIEKQYDILQEAKFKTCYVSPKNPKLPVFGDSYEEMDIFLLRFERYAEAQHWALKLSALLKGKTLDVFAILPKTDALDYNSITEMV